MCGIFGLIVKHDTGLKKKFISTCLSSVAKISIARGKDSSGIIFKNNLSAICEVVKGDIPITKLLTCSEYQEQLSKAIGAYESGSTFQAIGHARLVTSGSQLKPENNQPVIKNGLW